MTSNKKFKLGVTGLIVAILILLVQLGLITSGIFIKSMKVVESTNYYTMNQEKIQTIEKIVGDRSLGNIAFKKTGKKEYKYYLYNEINYSLDDVNMYRDYLIEQEGFELYLDFDNSLESYPGYYVLRKTTEHGSHYLEIRISFQENYYEIVIQNYK